MHYCSEKSANPLVSVIIPFFNRENFLAESIESVLAQSYQNWELILVNDGSTDGGEIVAEQFVCKYPNKIFLLNHENKRNRGAAVSRNLGIKHAKGKFICFLDSDDVYFPDTIERELNAFAAHPEADAVCGTLECWYSWDAAQSKKNAREKDFVVKLGLELEKLYEPPSLFVHNLLAGGRKPGICCILLRREAFQSIGRFEESFKNLGEDQVLWAKLSLNARIFVMNACLAKYRQHPDSSCAATISAGGHEAAIWLLYFDWLQNYLAQQKIVCPEVQNAVQSFQKEIRFQIKYQRFKKYYRRIFPLHTRYWLRDQLSRFKKKLRS